MLQVSNGGKKAIMLQVSNGGRKATMLQVSKGGGCDVFKLSLQKM
jgi:hypothetical protein